MEKETEIDEEHIVSDHVNLEVSFAYLACDGKETHQRSKNIHLLVQFFLGVCTASVAV